MTVPIHCRPERPFPNKITEASTVKNFLVVVTTESTKGPNSDTCEQKKKHC